jgi:McbB family protein
MLGETPLYIINDFQMVCWDSNYFLSHYNKAMRIPGVKLAEVLIQLSKRPTLEISESELMTMATSHGINFDDLKSALMNKLGVLQKKSSRMFEHLYINSDDDLVTSMLSDGFKRSYKIHTMAGDDFALNSPALLLMYRNNYTHADFKKVYRSLPDNVYLITAGVIHRILVIDNVYYKGSGLPTHFSNLNQLLAGMHSQLSITSNNWLLFYRALLKTGMTNLPEPELSSSQKGYISHSLSRFMNQFTDFWKQPTLLDDLNWFWHIDLNSMSVYREIATHSPFSEYEMNLNLENLQREVETCL